MNNNKICEICGKKDEHLGAIWYGQLDGLRIVWACEECRKVEEYVKGERGEREAHLTKSRGGNDNERKPIAWPGVSSAGAEE